MLCTTVVTVTVQFECQCSSVECSVPSHQCYGATGPQEKSDLTRLQQRVIFCVQCVVHSIQCTVGSVQYTVFCIQCALLCMQCALFIIQCVCIPCAVHIVPLLYHKLIVCSKTFIVPFCGSARWPQ